MDFHSQVEAVTRQTKRRGKSRLVELSQEFPCEPVEVWDALTSPEAMSQWFDELSGTLREGGRYRLGLSMHSGSIRRCDAPRVLEVTWEYENDVSKVRVSLSPTGGGTVLKLSHEVPPDEHWEMYGPAATGIGWDGALHALKLYLSGDARSNPKEMAALSTTPEGLRYITDVADAWRQAHVEAGEDPEEAETAATRTAMFYRGEKPIT